MAENGSTTDAQSPAPALVGQWGKVFALPNVAIHTHLLPSGKVLFWGRRDNPTDSLDVHSCTPHLWDPATGAIEATPQPKRQDNTTTVNLFCSGHSFLDDGRLFVAGGHLADSKGLDQATIYDYRTNAWTPLPVMNKGRWYPTVVTLRDGTPLVMSGSYEGPDGTTPVNEEQQVWDGSAWHSLVNFHGMPLYPRVHTTPDGQAFMAGPLALTQKLDTHGEGAWTPLPGPGGSRAAGQRDYAPSVMYQPGKVIYIGGGNDEGTHQPAAEAEIIDLTAPAPAWQPTASMHHRRRQHNATLLPDGTVLVTGGTQGGGGPNNGFNDLRQGEPVHEAELWDPATGVWSKLAPEAVDRCYHGTAILLPDATVLSAGGGEYRPDSPDSENPPQDTHRDGQIFQPPYLFKGPRPELTEAPAELAYGAAFTVGTKQPDAIVLVTLLRLSSVTHSFNANQRFASLDFRVEAGGLAVTAPAGPDICPPGHYMLFLLNHDKVPSVARIVRLAGAAPAAHLARVAATVAPRARQMSTAELDAAVTQQATGTHAVLGLTSTCPYGLGACWGGAYEALKSLDGAQFVRPIANAVDSTADVYLASETVPDVDRWAEQIGHLAKGSYDLRGVEISVSGEVARADGGLVLSGPLFDAPLPLRPLAGTQKVQFDRSTGRPRPAVEEELSAFDRLAVRADASPTIRVTGPLRKESGHWVLHLRQFSG